MNLVTKGNPLNIHTEVPALRRCATLPDARPNVAPLTSTSSTEDENLTGCTPALRRRRLSEKYVTDTSQLNLQFPRARGRSRPISEVISRWYPRGVPSHLLGEAGKRTEESSDNDSNSSGAANSQPPPPPSSLPPHIGENNARYVNLCFFYNSRTLKLLNSQFSAINLSKLLSSQIVISRKV